MLRLIKIKDVFCFQILLRYHNDVIVKDWHLICRVWRHQRTRSLVGTFKLEQKRRYQTFFSPTPTPLPIKLDRLYRIYIGDKHSGLLRGGGGVGDEEKKSLVRFPPRCCSFRWPTTPPVGPIRRLGSTVGPKNVGWVSAASASKAATTFLTSQLWRPLWSSQTFRRCCRRKRRTAKSSDVDVI